MMDDVGNSATPDATLDLIVRIRGEIARLLRREIPLRDALAPLLQVVLEFTGLESYALYLNCEAKDGWTLQAHLESSHLQTPTSWCSDAGTLSTADLLQTSRPCYVMSARHAPLPPPLPPLADICCYAVLPITAQGSADGMLLLVSCHETGFPESTRKFLEAIAVLLGQALARRDAPCHPAPIAGRYHGADPPSRERETPPPEHTPPAILTDFLNAVSHELKSPLTPICGGIELLQSGDIGPLNERQREVVLMIARQAARLRRVVNDLFDLDAFESGHFSLVAKPLEPGKVIADCLEAYQERFHARGLSLQYDPIPVAQVCADVQRLEQIIGNVLENALKYTTTGGVTIRVVEEDEMIRIEMSDTGIGIAPEHCEKIFQRYYQVDAQNQGIGFGLALVKQLVEAHGGQIWVESQLGVGSTFLFTLPKS